MSKKSLILVVSLVLALTMGLGGTLAFFTDRDSETNVFTVGNVDIELNEDFVQNSPLMPDVEINKDAWISNEGNNDAYVWMTVAVPAQLHDAVDLAWTDDANPEGPVEAKDADGNDYKVYLVKIEEPLAPGEETPVLLDSVTLKSNVDYQDGQFVLVEDGETTPIDYDLTSVQIPVAAFAIQSEGFTTFDDAYEAYGNQWGEFVVEVEDNVADTAEEAQEMLDNAEANTTILLAPGVDYGTLYIRQNLDNPAISTQLDSDWAGGGRTYERDVIGLTIVGAEGATVDNIKVEAGTYSPGGNSHSQDIKYLNSYINFNDILFQNIEFSGTEIAFSLGSQRGEYDGITFDGCKLISSADASKKVRLFYDDGKSDNPANLTIKDCYVEGAYQVIEIRPTENVTITNNEFKDIKMHTLLLSGASPRVYQNVVVENNTAGGLGERFLRVASVDGITVTGNTIENYNGADNDVIKLTNATNADVSGNTIPSVYTWTVE